MKRSDLLSLPSNQFPFGESSAMSREQYQQAWDMLLLAADHICFAQLAAGGQWPHYDDFIELVRELHTDFYDGAPLE